jgi:hypothetical protein
MRKESVYDNYDIGSERRLTFIKLRILFARLELREKIARGSWLIQVGCKQVLGINIKDSVQW